jgi:general secretion pathway protein E
VIELLVITNDMRALIAKQQDAAGLVFEAARNLGMRSIHEDSLDKALKGLTTVEEILRVLGRWR